MPFVVKIQPEKIVELGDYILHQEGSQKLVPTNPYEVFRIKIDDSHIIGYKTGKVVATTILAEKLLKQAVLSIDTHQVDYDVIIGSDEAGKGEWLGPIVVAAVELTPDQSSVLRSIGVMDSKELGPARIKELTTLINNSSTARKIVMIYPERFNELMNEIKDEQKTINDLLAWGHATALDSIYQSAKTKYDRIRVVIDEFDRIKTQERIKKLIDLRQIKLVQTPKAEEEIAVAAAGILARAAREIWIDKISNEIGVDLRSLRIMDVLSMGKSAYSFAKMSFIERSTSKKL